MLNRFQLAIFLIFFSCNLTYAQWIDLSDLKVDLETTELGGPRVVIDYNLSDPEISTATPAHVFIRVSKDSGVTWHPVPLKSLSGDGHGIVESSGQKKSIWWGVNEAGFSNLDRINIRVRGTRMVSVPGGRFVMKAVPGGGYDDSRVRNRVSSLPSFYIAKYETTISMYADYLNERGGDGTGWADRMSDPELCGIIREGSPSHYHYRTSPGRENYPMLLVSWYDAVGFLNWCGLRLPTEAEFEKAYRGGIYLDGDSEKKVNPMPERKFPWGNEEPSGGGVFRCNLKGAGDGFRHTAPVGSFAKFSSPYGVCDMAGNVGEWTLDWYATTYHVGLDGFRMVRGGSWRSLPSGVDAVSGATSLPIRESGIMGFRGAAQ